MTVEIPGYQIVRVLGKGGMATVYLAVQEIFERQVALKVMSTALAEDPTFGQRFLREARIVSQLVHPNIITVYDVGVHNNAYYLSMEYIGGPDLKQAREQLTLPQKIQIVLDIAQALDFAGSKGYVHRDIKPENILLRSDSLNAVLMDFGIARAAESDLSVTQTGMALGTPHYMSPEQAKGQAVDHRSDLYSLGVVFYYLLTGSVPYHADSAVAIGIKHITEPVPRLPEHLQALQKFIDGLMAKQPDKRLQSAADLISALKKVDLRALEKRQRAYEQQMREQAAASGDVTQLHVPASNPAIEPASTTHITRLNRVAGLLWQYKVVAFAAALTLFAALVLIKRPFSAEPAPPIVSAPKAKEAPAPVAAREPVDEPAEDEYEDETAPADSAPARDITLADIADREYREVKTQEPEARSKPVQILRRLKHKIQGAAGRRELREVTLDEKIAELRSKQQRDPNNLEPQRRLAWLASQYFKKANQFFNQGEFASAQAALERSRRLFPEYATLRDQLEQRLVNRDRLERHLGRARASLAAGKLVSPWRRNALHHFKAALDVDPELTVAQQGIHQVAAALMANARAQLAAGDVDEAADLAEEVLEIRPDNEEARQFLLKLEHRQTYREPPEPVRPPSAAERSISLREGTPLTPTADGPKIRQLRVDGKLLTGINARQTQTIPAQRVLFVSFEYADFPGERLELDAVLRDSSGNALVETPVAVDNKNGLNRFRMERERPGFGPGSYQLQLSLRGVVLISADFYIE